MRVAYVTTYDAADVRRWSGIGYFMARALEAQSLELVYVGPLRTCPDMWSRAKEVFYEKITRREYQRVRSPRLLRNYADQVAARLKDLDADVVLSPGTIPISALECDIPIVFWTDACFAGLVGFYPRWLNLCRETLADGHRMEQAALSRCQLAIYSSEWAAETATSAYQIDPSKVVVVPFGANVEDQRGPETIRRLVDERPSETCKLLFLGVDWKRKGGDVAIAVAESLNARGLKTELSIVGCDVSEPVPDCVSVEGFISKRTPRGQARIQTLLEESHFLILPTRADCTPIVIAEANSFGVPVITTDVGGISTSVSNGLNGYALPPTNDYVSKATDVILRTMKDPASYSELALTSFDEFDSRLNWQVAGRRVKDLLEATVAQQPNRRPSRDEVTNVRTPQTVMDHTPA